MVIFKPKQSGPPAVGMTDTNGRFELKTREKPGLAAGEYKVCVEGSAPSPGGEAGEIGWSPSKKPQTPGTGIPVRYTNVATSGFSANVVASGENVFKFEMKSQ